MKLKLLHSALACFVLYAVSCTHGLEKHAFGSVLDWRPWQQRARHVCHNQLLILIPIYGHLGGFLLLRQKGLCLEAPPATSSTKSCIYMQDSLPNPLTTQRQSWCLNLALQQVHSLFWICVDFAVQDGFGFLDLAGLIKHPNGPLKIVFEQFVGVTWINVWLSYIAEVVNIVFQCSFCLHSCHLCLKHVACK